MSTLLSLFDGSGGFPLAASLCGITPVAASEVEPYPIAVTRSRSSEMKHLGSVTDVKGNEIEPVDIITFGSPCQDLSVAGLRKGLKHEENGDDETTRSGLFMSEKDYAMAHEYSAQVYAAVEVLVNTEVLTKEESYAILDELTKIRKKKG